MRSLRDWLLRGLLPAAAGHAAAMALGLATALGGLRADGLAIPLAAFALLAPAIAWRRRAREIGLAACSFLAGGLHGAGLALVPALLPLCASRPWHAGPLAGAVGEAGAHLLVSAAGMALLAGAVRRLFGPR